jgi:hypothetical protein
MTTTATVSTGYDLGFAWDHPHEPPGTWWGPGAEALGLQSGSTVSELDYRLLFGDRRSPRDGALLGRFPPGPYYYDVILEVPKSVSVFWASLGANLRDAASADDAAHWSEIVSVLDEVVLAANTALLGYLQREAGYVGVRSPDDLEFSRPAAMWDAADLATAVWVHHISAGGNPHIHVHNQVAALARTRRDGLGGQVDLAGLQTVAPALGAISGLALEAAMTQRLGVHWVERPDGEGREVEGIPQDVMDALSDE